MEIKLRQVLVVDDDRAFRDSLIRTLRRLGHDAIASASARDAYAKVGASKPDVMLLDLQMPEVNGHAFLRVLDRAQIDIPVIVMSGAGQMEDVIQVLRSRAVDYLRKPFHADELGAALDRALDNSSEGRARKRIGPEGVARGGPARSTTPATTDRPRAVDEPRCADVAELLNGLQQGRLQLPPLSPLGSQVHRFFHSPPDDIGEVVALLSRDTAVCGGVLTVANSTLYSARRPLATIKEAVLRLGTKRACSAAHELLLKEAFARDVGPFTDLLERMWASNLLTAEGAREIARIQGSLHPDEVHLAALMHNIGELTILRLVAQHWGEAPPGDEDLNRLAGEIARHHEAFGQWQLSNWDVAPRIVRLASRHHPPVDGPETTEDELLRKIVHLSWSLTIQTGHAYLPGQEAADVEGQALTLRLRPEAVEAVFEEIDSHG